MAANTFTLLASQTLTGSQASVTFSNILQTYTDLCLVYSVRGDVAATYTAMYVKLNSNSSNVYSNTYLTGNSSAAASNSDTQTTNGGSGVFACYVDGANATSSTFGNGELYIPSYTASQNKPMGSFAVTENNATTANAAWDVATASLFASTTAISSLAISLGSGNIVSGSSFYLYGIKNS